MVRMSGVFDPLNQGAKGPAPPLEQKNEDRFTLSCNYLLILHNNMLHFVIYAGSNV